MTPSTPALRRYARRAGLALGAYVVSALAVAGWAAGSPGIVRGLLALAPALPVLAAVVATSRYVAEEAEPLQRAIQTEAMLWAVGVTFTIATAWGLLEPLAGAPHVPSYTAFAVFSSVVAAVQLARRRFPRR